MQIALSKAKARLSELAARAENGEDVVLTRRGLPAVRLVAERRQPTLDEKRAMIAKYRGILKARPDLAGVTSDNISDFLYDGCGLPA